MLVKTIVFIWLTIDKVFSRFGPGRLEFHDFPAKSRRSLAFSEEDTVVKHPGLRRSSPLWENDDVDVFQTETFSSVTIGGCEFGTWTFIFLEPINQHADMFFKAPNGFPPCRIISKIEKSPTNDTASVVNSHISTRGASLPERFLQWNDHVTVYAKDAIEKNRRQNKFSSLSVFFAMDIKKETRPINPKNCPYGLSDYQIDSRGFYSSHEHLIYMIYQSGDKVSKKTLLGNDLSSVSNVYLSEKSPGAIRDRIQAFIETTVCIEVTEKPFKPETRNTSDTDDIKGMFSEMDSGSFLPSLVPAKLREPIMETAPFPLNATEIVSIVKALKSFEFSAGAKMFSLMSLEVNKILILQREILKNKKTRIYYSMRQELSERVFRITWTVLGHVENLEKTMAVRPKIFHDDLTREKAQIQKSLRAIMAKAIKFVEITGTNSLCKNLVDQKAVEFRSDALVLNTRRIRPRSFSGMNITASGSTKSFISLSEEFIEYLNENYKAVDYQFASYLKNPFWWHKNNCSLNTELISFDLFNGWEKVRVANHFIYVTVKTKDFPLGILKGDLSGEKLFQVHKLRLEKNEKLILTFEANEESFKVFGSSSSCTKEDFSKGLEVKPGTEPNFRTIQLEGETGKKVMYICIMKTGNSPLAYKGFYAVFKCAYWVPETGDWRSDGCRVQKATLLNGSDLNCKCRHASLFAGLITTPPNVIHSYTQVDFNTAFTRNWAVVLPPAIGFIFWFFAVLWARQIDKKLKKKNVISVLDDNMPGDEHVYIMVVTTGFFLDASTTADVAFQVIGSNSDSRVHVIKSTGNDLLQRNSQDWLLFYTPHKLGKIKMIRLWHNSKGQRPHWYCSRIIIHHVTTGYEVFFNVNKWFSLIWGDGKVYREIKPLGKDKFKSAKVLFPIKFETRMKNNTMWLSIFARDPQSSFTSVERVSCSTAFLFLCPMIRILIYDIPNRLPEELTDHIHWNFINYGLVAKALVCYAIAFPIVFAIGLVLQLSRPKNREGINIYDWKLGEKKFKFDDS